MKIGENIPLGITYDEKGNLLTCKNLDGYWCTQTYDNDGYILTYKNSKADWYEYTRDENGRALTYKDSYGNDRIYLHHGIYFNLSYNYKNQKYEAGCQCLTYDECLDFYDENKDEFDDAEKFIEIIKNHHLTLQNKSV